MQQPLILIVDDAEDDVLLLRKALRRSEISCGVQAVNSGEEALAYLQGEGRFSNQFEHPLPDLVLLDLKMPRMDGFEVLQWIRRQENFHALRVVVLTASEDAEHVNRAYQLGANSFVVKPMEFESLVVLARQLQDYWLLMDNAPRIKRPPAQRVARTTRKTRAAQSPERGQETPRQ